MNPESLPLEAWTLPEAPHWWPLPVAFWLALGLLILLVALTIHFSRPWRERRRRRRLALQQWQALNQRDDQSWTEKRHQLNQLLRNLATAAGESRALSWSPEQWSGWLHQQLPESEREAAGQFLQSLYRERSEFSPEIARQQVPKWLRRLA